MTEYNFSLIDLMARLECAKTIARQNPYTGRDEIGYFVSDSDLLQIKKNLRILADSNNANNNLNTNQHTNNRRNSI